MLVSTLETGRPGFLPERRERATAEEMAARARFIDGLKDPIWNS